MSRILLLEDDLGLIDGLIFALEKNGFEVAVVRTITEAATVVSEQKFDILLLGFHSVPARWRKYSNLLSSSLTLFYSVVV